MHRVLFPFQILLKRKKAKNKENRSHRDVAIILPFETRTECKIYEINWKGIAKDKIWNISTLSRYASNSKLDNVFNTKSVLKKITILKTDIERPLMRGLKESKL